MGGNATTAVRLGMADVGLLTLTEVADHARRINDAAGLPLLIDADNGYGNALNVRRAVREFERAGVAGLHIEDQASPKRCGHFAGKQLIGTGEMVGKIKAALDARRDPDMVIIARTDATAVDGFDAALERAQAYIEAGADMLLMAPPLDLAQLEAAGRLGAPLLCPLDSTGLTPVAPADDLASLGVKIGVFPTALVMVSSPLSAGCWRRSSATAPSPGSPMSSRPSTNTTPCWDWPSSRPSSAAPRGPRATRRSSLPGARCQATPPAAGPSRPAREARPAR